MLPFFLGLATEGICSFHTSWKVKGQHFWRRVQIRGHTQWGCDIPCSNINQMLAFAGRNQPWIGIVLRQIVQQGVMLHSGRRCHVLFVIFYGKAFYLMKRINVWWFNLCKIQDKGFRQRWSARANITTAACCCCCHECNLSIWCQMWWLFRDEEYLGPKIWCLLNKENKTNQTNGSNHVFAMFLVQLLLRDHGWRRALERPVLLFFFLKNLSITAVD